MSRGKSPFMRRFKRGLSTRGLKVKLYPDKGCMRDRRAKQDHMEQVSRCLPAARLDGAT